MVFHWGRGVVFIWWGKSWQAGADSDGNSMKVCFHWLNPDISMEVPDRIGEEVEKLSCHTYISQDYVFLFGFFTDATSCDLNIQNSRVTKWEKAQEFPKKASRAIFRMSEITRKPSWGQILIKSDALIQDKCLFWIRVVEKDVFKCGKWMIISTTLTFHLFEPCVLPFPEREVTTLCPFLHHLCVTSDIQT